MIAAIVRVRPRIIGVAAAMMIAGCSGQGNQPAATSPSSSPAPPKAGFAPAVEIQPPDRTLAFPDAPDVGRLYISDWEARVDDQSSVDREARGSVEVPRDLEVYLWIGESRATDLAFLDALGPDDLQGIIFPRPHEVSRAPLPEAELARLGRLTGLRSLDFAATPLGGASLAPLAPLVHLERLHLGLTGIGDSAIAPLASLSSLRHLDLQSTRITDASLAAIGKLDGLEHLNLARTAVTDAGVGSLISLSRLRVLFLAHTGLTDASVDSLSKLGSLETLYLFDTQLTTKGLERLRPTLPKCRIFPQALPRRISPTPPADPALPIS